MRSRVSMWTSADRIHASAVRAVCGLVCVVAAEEEEEDRPTGHHRKASR
jgi:hypothetical protein